MPERIANAPELQFGNEFYYQSFWHLTSDRPSGFGPAPIPSGAIRGFCRDEGLTESESSDMMYLIRRMDAVWMEVMDGKQKSEAKRTQARHQLKGGK